jgi:alpha-beta hydrolase superfamily lysophospholipase
VIVNGFTEFMGKWAEFVYDLKAMKSGYSVFLYDHRGQGESQRLIDDSRKGYVKNYQDYVDDLAQFMDQVVKPQAKGDVFMLAHSMGGGVATAYLIQHPKAVKAFVACSPMYAPTLTIADFSIDLTDELELNAKVKLSQIEGLATSELLLKLGKGEHYAPGKSQDGWIHNPAQNNLTTSAPRMTYIQHELETHTDQIIAGPTNQWVHEAVRLGFYVRKNAASLTAPTLIFRASNDLIVEPQMDDIFKLKAHARVLEFPGAKHEIFVEADRYRKRAVRAALWFFGKNASQSAQALRASNAP